MFLRFVFFGIITSVLWVVALPAYADFSSCYNQCMQYGDGVPYRCNKQCIAQVKSSPEYRRAQEQRQQQQQQQQSQPQYDRQCYNNCIARGGFGNDCISRCGATGESTGVTGGFDEFLSSREQPAEGNVQGTLECFSGCLKTGSLNVNCLQGCAARQDSSSGGPALTPSEKTGAQFDNQVNFNCFSDCRDRGYSYDRCTALCRP